WRLIGLDCERGVHVVVTFTSADHQARRPSAERLFRRWDEVREVAGRRLAVWSALKSMVRSLGIIVRLTLRGNASVPLGLGVISAPRSFLAPVLCLSDLFTDP